MLICDLLKQAGQHDEWLPWASPFDGPRPERFEAGNPIASGRSRVLDRAFRIIQDAETGNRRTEGWVQDYRSEREGTDLPAAELFVVLAWSSEAVEHALALLGRWIRSETTIEDMRRVIEAQASSMESDSEGLDAPA